MPTTIKLKNSVTTTNAPTSLVQGEVAINITDKKVWVGDAATTPIQLLGAGASASFSALSCTTLSASGVATFSAGTVSAPAITTSGDTNTGIFFPAADTIAFAEGGAEAIRIDSAGRLLIGASSSVGNANANNLELTNPAGSGVCGLTFNVNSGSANTGNLYWRSNASNNAIQIVGDPITNYLAFATSGTEKVRIDSSGNVGIGGTPQVGQSSQTERLQVLGTDGPTSSISSKRYSADAIGPQIRTYKSRGAFVGTDTAVQSGDGILNLNGYGYTGSQYSVAGSINLNADAAPSGTTLQGRITFFTTDSGGSHAERMRIDSSGNVGIGTSSPTARLTVSDASGRKLDISPNSSGIDVISTSQPLRLITSDASNMIFQTNNTERMRITSGGLLLVNSTSTVLSSQHNITGGTDAGLGVMTLQNASNTTYSHSIGANSSGAFIVYRTSDNAGVYLSWGGTSWTANSDERLKTDLKPITDAINKVSTLRAVTGRYKKDEENVSRSFLIAQDVQKVLPEAINEQDDENKTLGLSYTDTIPLLVAAIKELNTDLANTKLLLTEVSNKVEAQAAEIALLKSK